MNKSSFISIIQQPEKIDSAQVNSLKSLVEQFPYCTTAQILLAKGLHNTQDISFEKQLRISAAYAIDRTVLHHLILEKTTTANTEEILDVETKNSAEVTQLTVVAKKTAEEDVTATQNEEISEANLAVEEPIIEIEEADPFLEREILSAAIHSTYLLEADIIEEEKEEEEKNVPSNEPILKDDSEHSFSEWLKLMDGQTIAEENSTTENKPLKSLSKELVNKFITEAPQIKPKKEFYSASNMARLSVKENDDLVTETLANIYAQQGNKEKAISAYEKLALKYPEKRIYFANLIHKLGDEPKK